MNDKHVLAVSILSAMLMTVALLVLVAVFAVNGWPLLAMVLVYLVGMAGVVNLCSEVRNGDKRQV
jgi:ABC-type bacteriocin/lantibiotic exporter with double-glycine peptidase domain